MSLDEIRGAAQRHKLIMLMVVLAIFVPTLAITARQSSVYESQASVALYPGNSSYPAVALYGNFSQGLLATYTQVVQSPTFLNGVAKDLSFPESGTSLASAVSVAPVANAAVLNITARSGNPAHAAEIARVTANRFIASANASGTIVKMVLTQTPQVPPHPVNRHQLLVLAAALIVALLFGIVGACVWDRGFPRVHSPQQLANAVDLPLLGVIPRERSSKLRQGAAIFIGDPSMASAEEGTRILRTNLMFVIESRGLRSVAPMSLRVADGKSTVVANLGVVLAEAGMPTIIVDADLHRPSQHTAFGVTNEKGLSTLGASAEGEILSTPYPDLGLLTSGPPPKDRADEVQVYSNIVPALQGGNAFLLVDSQPLLAGADTRLLARAVDAVILVTRAGSAHPKELREAIHSLRIVGVSVLGTVLTQARRRDAERWRTGYRAGPDPTSISDILPSDIVNRTLSVQAE